MTNAVLAAVLVLAIAATGVGKVQAGTSYSAGVTGAAELFLDVNGDFGPKLHTLGDANGSRPVTITYDTIVTAFGLGLQAYNCCGPTGIVQVFDCSNLPLTTADVQGAINGAEALFGYENAAGIGRVVVSPSDGCLMIDDHGFGQAVAAAVPKPATWAMMLVGFGMVGTTARYRRRKSSVVYA